MDDYVYFDLCSLSALFLWPEIELVWVIHQHILFGVILEALS